MKKPMLKLSSFLVIAVLLFSLAACSGNSSNTSSSSNANGVTNISISTWGSPDELNVFNTIVTNFEKQNPKIKVKVIHIPQSGYSQKMNTMLAGGSAPDVVFASDGDFGRWVSSGLFKDLQPYVNKSKEINTNDMWSSSLVRYRYNGSKLGQGDLYAIPKDIGPSVIYYNEDLFKKAGVPFPSATTPMTFQQLVKVGQQLTLDKNGKHPNQAGFDPNHIVQYGFGPAWWEGFVWSNGGQLLNDSRTKLVLDQPAAEQAMQFAADISNKYHFAPTTKAQNSMSADQMFQTGKLAMITSGRWMVPTYRKLSFKWDVAPNPTGSTGQPISWSGSVGFAMSKSTKNPDAAWKLIQYFGGKQGQKEMAALGFSIPTFKSMANTNVFLQPGKEPEHASVFIQAAKLDKPGEWSYLPNTKWLDDLNQKLGDLWSGKTSAKVLLPKITPEINQQIKQGNPSYFK